MDCYKIARRIMDRIRELPEYSSVYSSSYHKVFYYDDSVGTEYFSLSYDGITVRVIKGKIFKVEVDYPRGIIHFNLRLWLLQLDRMMK